MNGQDVVNIQESLHDSSPNHLATDLNDSGNASNLSVEDSGSTNVSRCCTPSCQEGDTHMEEAQKRKVTFCTEVTVAQVVPGPNIQGKFVKA